MTLFIISILLSTAPARAETSRAHLAPDARAYLQARPQWAIELSGAPLATGDRAVEIAGKGSEAVRSFLAQAEFQPAFLQGTGVWGFGPSFGLYAADRVNGAAAPELVSGWSVGGQVRYQARFFSEQILVPMVSYSLDNWRCRLRSTDENRSLFAQGPSVGLWLLLNGLSQAAGERAFYEMGLARTYVVLEYKRLFGRDDRVKIDGSSFYFGLRFEL